MVHTFAGKKTFFKSVQYFFFISKYIHTNTQTHKQTPPKTNIGKIPIFLYFLSSKVKKIASKESMAVTVDNFAGLNQILGELEEKICDETKEQGMDVCTT